MSAPPTHKLILEIEVPDFYVDGTTPEVAAESECAIVDIVTDEWMREDVGLTFVTIPGEKSQNHEFEVHAMNGRIVGARIVESGSVKAPDVLATLAAARRALEEVARQKPDGTAARAVQIARDWIGGTA